MNFGLLNKLIRKLKNEGIRKTTVAILRYPFKVKTQADYKKMLRLDDYKERFSKIYEKNLWGCKESGSGGGSGVDFTENLRNWLPRIIKAHNIKRIVDAPCGDFNWMRLVLPKVDVTYLGFDIVEPVIQKNKELYSNKKIEFGVADICSDSLPSCDLLIVRDCLFHLSNSDIDRFLKNIKNCDYKYLLVSTNLVKDEFNNLDITTGDCRLIDLFDKPFCFEQNSVIDRVDDFPQGYSNEREMVLVRKEHVPTGIQKTPS